MKTTFIFILIFFSFLIVSAQENNFDKIEDTDILIKNTRNHTWALGSAEELQKAFGKALVTKRENEMGDGYYHLYEYQGLKVFYNGLENDVIILSKSLYRLFLNGTSYKKRDKISKLEPQFPVSFKNKEENKDLQTGRIRIGIAHQNVVTDGFILMDYNKKGVITKITVGKLQE